MYTGDTTWKTAGATPTNQISGILTYRAIRRKAPAGRGRADAVLAAVHGDFNHRQVVLLEAILKDPSVKFTMRTHSGAHVVSLETARHDLMDLERRGLLVRLKRGRQFEWRSVEGLEDLLRKSRR